MKSKIVFLGIIALIAQSATAQNSAAKVEMVRIPGGTFRMGKEWGEGDDVTPVHAVTLSDFYMSKYKV